MTSKIRHLAARSQRVYENTMLEHFAEEFEKQQQIQMIKFAMILLCIIIMSSLAILTPLTLMQHLKSVLL